MANKMQQRAIHLELPKNDNLDIEFDGLAYVVPYGKGKKEVLHKISGKFNSGELTAIMGPSGAGKSSLLNILTGFQKTGTSGSIRCTGQEEKADGKIQYKKDCCYILQDDRLCPLFTVSEVMNMAAKLKIGDSISEKAKELLIFDILDTLGLKNSLDTKCSRLSGGQKKRLSIALELIDNPPIMFLDEPTTGLDSSSSLQCVSMLKNLARGGRTIVCTIHQPSATIFEMFDHIYVLAEGHCIYQGAATNTVSFLSSVGLECPQYHNPADYLLEVANGEYGNFVEKLATVTKETNWRMIEPSNMVVEKEMLDNDNSTKTMVLIQSPSEWYKFRILFKRSLVQLYRDWTVTHLKMILHVLVGIFVGVLYLNYGDDGSKSIKNIGYFIVSIVYLIYTSMMPAIVRFPAEVPIIKKESFNNWYKLRTYYFANILANMPLQIIFSIIYTLISYAISGQPFEGHRLCKFFAITILVTLTAEGIGIIFGTTVNPINGTFLGAITTALLLVLAGFLILFSHMSKIMYALSYFSYIAYAFEALVQTMYGNGRENLPCPTDVIYCHYKSPTIILKDLGMSKDNYLNDVAFLLGNFLLAKVVGFCTLRRKVSMGTS